MVTHNNSGGSGGGLGNFFKGVRVRKLSNLYQKEGTGPYWYVMGGGWVYLEVGEGPGEIKGKVA